MWVAGDIDAVSPETTLQEPLPQLVGSRMAAPFPFRLSFPEDLFVYNPALSSLSLIDSRFIVAAGFTLSCLLLFPNPVDSVRGINFLGPSVLFVGV